MFNGIEVKRSKNEEERQNHIKNSSRLLQEEKNPCMKEHELSYKCLSENSFKREDCAFHFENYKRCKDFWSQVRLERRIAGIVPNLPPAEEREQIKREHLAKRRNDGRGGS
ncbi:coiled-coil-helix-coiled-coil-helix domain-containing protein 7 isoform X2 [Oratosquilla oratoria]